MNRCCSSCVSSVRSFKSKLDPPTKACIVTAMVCGVMTAIGVMTSQAFHKETKWMIWTGAAGMIACVVGGVYTRVVSNDHRYPTDNQILEYERI